LRPRVRLFARLRDKITSIGGSARILAVTAGDGACEENSTQPTARVSTLTANGVVRPGSGPASKRRLQGASKTRSRRSHRNSGRVRGRKQGTESAKLTVFDKTALGGVYLQAMASLF
jgi:hypothetical protein